MKRKFIIAISLCLIALLCIGIIVIGKNVAPGLIGLVLLIASIFLILKGKKLSRGINFQFTRDSHGSLKRQLDHLSLVTNSQNAWLNSSVQEERKRDAKTEAAEVQSKKEQRAKEEKQVVIQRELAVFQGPEDPVAKEVWLWLRNNEGKKAKVDFTGIVAGNTYKATGEWVIVSPGSISPLEWLLPIKFYSNKNAKLLLADVDYGAIVDEIHNHIRQAPKRGHHEITIVSDKQLEYRIGISATHIDYDGGMTWSYLEPDPAKVRYWQIYSFHLM